MNKKEFLNHSNEVCASLLEKAYDAGFEQATRELKNEEKENITWVDLGLPSGKLWGYQNIPSHKCVDINSIPSKEDFEELYWNTRLCLNDFYIGETRYWVCYFIGRTGSTLRLKVWEQQYQPEINISIYSGTVINGTIYNTPNIVKFNSGFYVTNDGVSTPDSSRAINLFVK